MPLFTRQIRAASISKATRSGSGPLGAPVRRVTSRKAVRRRVRVAVLGQGPLAGEVRRQLAGQASLAGSASSKLRADLTCMDWVADRQLGAGAWLTNLLNDSIDALLIDAGADSVDQATRALERGIDVVLDGSQLLEHEVLRLGRIAARTPGRLRWCTAPTGSAAALALSALARSA